MLGLHQSTGDLCILWVAFGQRQTHMIVASRILALGRSALPALTSVAATSLGREVINRLAQGCVTIDDEPT